MELQTRTWLAGQSSHSFIHSINHSFTHQVRTLPPSFGKSLSYVLSLRETRISSPPWKTEVSATGKTLTCVFKLKTRRWSSPSSFWSRDLTGGRSRDLILSCGHSWWVDPPLLWVPVGLSAILGVRALAGKRTQHNHQQAHPLIRLGALPCCLRRVPFQWLKGPSWL